MHWHLDEIPGKLVVIGGGYVGTELGTAYANFGTEVTILEGANDILSGFEKQMTALVKRNLKKKKVDVVTKAMAKGVEETENGVIVTYEAKGEEQTVEADYVLVTVGRKPNTDELGLEQVGIKMDERGIIKLISSAERMSPVFLRLVILFRDHHLHIKHLTKVKLQRK